MDLSLVLKIAGVGMIVSITYMILNKSGRDEMAMLVSLGGVVVILLMIVSSLSSLMDSIKNIFGL